MFLANSLKEKLKRTYLENDPDAIGKPPFSYNPPPNDPRVLLSFKGTARGLPPNPSEEFTTQKLQAMDTKEWSSKFTVPKLRREWQTKVEIDFEDKHKKFPDDMMLPKVIKSKEYVKELIDPDILELKQKRWNISSDCQTKLRPELKKTLFEVSHGLKDFKVVPLKEHVVEEGCDSRDNRIVDGMKWEISTKLEENEKKYLHEATKELAIDNSNRYWKENEYNRENGEPYPISEDRKKVEIIRYFKKYRTPYQKSMDLYKTMQKVQDLTALERAEVEKNVLYKNPGSRYQERINALVFKEMFNTYRYKYNELTGKLDKEEIKRRQREENKFRWRDDDLVQKIISINNLEDIKWFKPNYTKERISQSQDKLRRELLRPLVIKGNDIHIEQEKIKEKLDEEEKKRQKRELLLKQKYDLVKPEYSCGNSRFDFYMEKGDERYLMEVKGTAMAGTLESSDAQVTIEPGINGIELSIESSVINQYGKKIRATVLETLERLEVKDAKVTVVDKGALDCTLKARVEGAVFRASGYTEDEICAGKKLPWGGAIQ